MSVNIRSQNRNTTTETKNSINNSVNLIQVRYFDKNINNKRYSNSSNKNNIYEGRGREDEKIEKLNKIYLTKEREYNNLVSQYKEIFDCLYQKREFLNQNKSKYQTLITNNDNMKMILLKLLKIKGNKLI